MSTAASHSRTTSPLYLPWLRLCMAGVFLMIAIGGFTRLSGSGLSIVEWKPIVGTLPPLSHQAWQGEFSKYKASPEYQQVNFDISFRRFQFIYMVEYIHRLVGRLVGLLFFLPLAFFWIRGSLSTFQKRYFITLTFIGISQGFMGWYMVKSGLVDDPMVNPARLTAHLLIATLILTLFYHEVLRVCHHSKIKKHSQNHKRTSNLALIGFIASVCTLTYGGLVAGHKAGLIYNTFPLMDGSLIPTDQWIANKGLANLYQNPAIVQFIHRILAFITFGLGLMVARNNLKSKTAHSKSLFIGSLLLISALVMQLLLGILTLLHSVPLSLALAHQLLGIIVVMLFFRNLFFSRN
ncbi:MAG: heme A synthase [Rickettsiales bacterium]|nr:heme A synthase [Rickettsiales bacterium]|tara:strand:- start:2775 stop:3824 length:1050 start_codon:yes stop_codon:yes gene_type:complete